MDEVAAKLGIPYYLHPYDGIHPIDVLPAAVHYEKLDDGVGFTFGGVTMEALWVPGHTLGNSVLLVDGPPNVVTPAGLAQRAGAGPDDFVIEVGTGLGVLTRALAARAARVRTVEIDAGLVLDGEEVMEAIRQRIEAKRSRPGE